jgi:hypothetical protein
MSVADAELEALIQKHDQKVGEAVASRRVAEGVQPEALFIPKDYSEVPVGRLDFIDRIRLRWLRPDLFLFIPRVTQPFSFVRHSGERIEPRTMITDGGTIPKIAGIFSPVLTPFGFLPCYLIHDWEFERHHCGATKSFEEVRDTMMEALKTMMESGLVQKDVVAFSAIYAAIDSFIARGYWNRNPPVCTIPADQPE